MKKIININAQYATDIFADFWRDRTVGTEFCREREDFSPEGQINVRYIDSFADRNPAARLDLIA